jgi:hypothetical protein
VLRGGTSKPSPMPTYDNTTYNKNEPRVRDDFEEARGLVVYFFRFVFCELLWDLDGVGEELNETLINLVALSDQLRKIRVVADGVPLYS